MKYMFILTLLFVYVHAALAETPPTPVLDDKDCQYLTEHIPNSDVEYKAAVDVHGKPVVEADLSPHIEVKTDQYSFPVTMDVAEYIGLAIPHGMESTMNIGMITVENGRVLFNGKPLDSQAELQLRALCTDTKKASE